MIEDEGWTEPVPKPITEAEMTELLRQAVEADPAGAMRVLGYSELAIAQLMRERQIVAETGRIVDAHLLAMGQR